MGAGDSGLEQVALAAEFGEEIVDHRTYTLHPGKTNEYLETYEKHGFAIQTKHLGQPVGYFFSEIGPMNQIVHIWKYKNLAERDERLQVMYRADGTADIDESELPHLSGYDGAKPVRIGSGVRPPSAQSEPYFSVSHRSSSSTIFSSRLYP